MSSSVAGGIPILSACYLSYLKLRYLMCNIRTHFLGICRFVRIYLSIFIKSLHMSLRLISFWSKNPCLAMSFIA
jgi:hypothetical protein